MRSAPISNICIVGGGPAGLAAAIAVSQLGFRATIVDHAFPPIDKTCGEGLMPDTVEVLGRLGVTVPCDFGHRFRGISFSDASSSVAADFPHGFGLGVRRTVLHNLLLQRAQELGVTCIWGSRNIQFLSGQVLVDQRVVNHDFIIAADGQNSLARRVLGLHRTVREKRRYAFRRHYRIAPWSSYVELHWAPNCQLYVTPVAANEVCLVAMSGLSQLRLDDALQHFPALRTRIEKAHPVSREMGALSVSRKLRRVWRNEIALVGDASGSVDAITGEGLCLSFKQALSLAEALRAGDLARYQAEHVRLSRRPHLMGRLMLTLDLNGNLQRRALASLAAHPDLFASLLRVHVGAQAFSDLLSWQLVHFCRAFLTV